MYVGDSLIIIMITVIVHIDQPRIVLEYLPYGDLKTFLIVSCVIIIALSPGPIPGFQCF